VHWTSRHGSSPVYPISIGQLPRGSSLCAKHRGRHLPSVYVHPPIDPDHTSYLRLHAYSQSHDKCFSASEISGLSAYSPFCVAAWYRSPSSCSDTGRRFGSGARTARHMTVNWSKPAFHPFIRLFRHRLEQILNIACQPRTVLISIAFARVSRTLSRPFTITPITQSSSLYARHPRRPKNKCAVLVRNQSIKCMYPP
jgi:hypothetical protein